MPSTWTDIPVQSSVDSGMYTIVNEVVENLKVLSGSSSETPVDNIYNIDARLDILEANLGADPKFRITMHTPHGFHGDVIWRSATQLQIKPKPKDGQIFTGAILNDVSDGGFLSLTADYVVDITTAGDGGILDGVTRIADAWYRLVAYMGSDEALHFGLSWMPVTSFSNNNPTSALTLNTVTPVGGAGTNIGTLFSIGGRLVVWNATTKFETPIFYSGGALDATRNKPRVKSDRSATSLTLEDVLSIANFSANDSVYQVDGFKPLQVGDGLIASAIGDRGYMDTGIRLRTDESGNILPFVIIGNEFYYCNGTGSADYSWDNGLFSLSMTGSWVNFRTLGVPADKCGIYLFSRSNTADIYTKPYYMAYGEVIGDVTYSLLVRSESRQLHGILSAKASNGAFAFSRGYII